MEKSSKGIILFCILCVILGFVLGLLCELTVRPRGEPQEVVRTDTITKFTPISKYDTIIKYVYVKAPIAQHNEKERTIPPDIETQTTQDNPAKAKKPTGFCWVSDSVDVVLPITQKEYADSDYHAWVSGFMPSLDSIRIYGRTIERIRSPDKRSRVHLTLGVGAAYNGKIEPALFLGVGYSICEIKL